MARSESGRAVARGLLERNWLLSRLTNAERAEILPHVRMFDAWRGTELVTPGEPMDSVLLPCGAVIAQMVTMPDGRTAEAGLIGSEGFVGSLSLASPHPAFARAVVLIEGPVAVVGLGVLKGCMARSPNLADGMARFADCYLGQLLQAIACNARHPLEKRLARWLLMVRDMQGGGEVPLTQGAVSGMLGVQRTSVTAAAARLQRDGVIDCTRGHIRIVDREGLQRSSCGCGVPVRLHYDRQMRRAS